MSLRQSIFGYIARKYAEQHPRAKQFIDYEHAKSILVLYESEPLESRTTIDRIAQALRNDGKQVIVIGYVAKKHADAICNTQFTMLSKENVNWLHKPNESAINEVNGRSFDMIIDLTRRICIPLQYVLMYAQAPCKVGGFINKFGLIDLAISLPNAEDEDVEEATSYEYELHLFDAMVHYLKEIKMCD